MQINRDGNRWPHGKDAEDDGVKPLCADLFAGLGGWSKGFLAEGWDCIGFDVERHQYGGARYPAQLVLQDVLTLHGSQFRNADCIVASPPCQEFSYMAMPFSRGKREASWQRWLKSSPLSTGFHLNDLFDACFRIQREASEAAGRHIPLVVENVKGAQPWVGRAAWHYGSYYLWGDVPALMPFTASRKSPPGSWDTTRANYTTDHSWMPEGVKTVGHANIRDGHTHTRHLTNQRESDAVKNQGGSWFAVAHNTESGHSRNPVNGDGTKQGGDWFGDTTPGSLRSYSSRSGSRKAASAMIAEIPFELSSYIARSFRPQKESIA